MSATPAVSIIIPTHNDELWVEAALESCIRQTRRDIEIVCVDDASTDSTRAIIERFTARDPRVRLIVQEANRSAFQARRVGVEAATATHMLFLDGDDELAPEAVQVALDRARESGADVVGFGVDVLLPDGRARPAFEAALQPTHASLSGSAILATLMPVGRPAHGHIWGYLFKTDLVRNAYVGLSADVSLPRANDLPVTFLALAGASSYASTPDRLYRYFFRRGTSGQRVKSVAEFEFFLGAIGSIEMIEKNVRAAAEGSTDPAAVMACYESARLSVVGNVLGYIDRGSGEELQRACLGLVHERVGELDIVRASLGFCPKALPLLARASIEKPVRRAPVNHVLFTTADLSTGGVQGVVASQARYLVAAGLQVTIAVHRPGAVVHDLPAEVHVVQVEGETPAEKLSSWVDICRGSGADIIIDPRLLYNRTWPFFAIASRALGIPTIGCTQSFALRPVLNDNDNTSFLLENLPLLDTVTTLSDTDVAFWKLHGIPNVVCLPNPPSPLLLELTPPSEPKAPPVGMVKLVWWGRLQQSTKRARSLILIAAALRDLGADIELTIIGPDTADLTAAQLLDDAVEAGIADVVRLRGPLHGQELIDELSAAHLYVSTSVIEGSPLALVEAQALGLPVAMYELPWLANLEGNEGVIAAPQDDVQGLARQIAEVIADPERYVTLSAGSLAAARRATDLDFSTLLKDLVNGELAAQFSPEPSLSHAKLLLEWTKFYSEGNARRHADERKEVVTLRREFARLRTEVLRLRKEVLRLRKNSNGQDTSAVRSARSVVARVRRRVLATAPGRGTSSPAGSKRPVVAPSVDTPQRGAAAHEEPTVSRAPTTARTSTVDVTVVIPVYDSEPWLDECLSSVLSQSNVAMEVICINDGSTDGSRDILSRYAAQDPRVRIIDQPNSGQSVGRNAGLDAAAGRYVIFLDSDDYWSLDALSTLVRRADDDELDLLLLECHAVRDPGVTDEVWNRHATYYPRTREYEDVRTGLEMMVAMRRGRDYRVHVGLYLARTGYVRSVGVRFIPGIVHQDGPYTFALLLHAPRTAHTRTDLYARRLRPGSTITTLKAASSAKGYFLGYVSMVRQVSAQEFTPVEAGVLSEIVHDAFQGAQKQLEQLPRSIANELRNLDLSPEAQLAFCALRSARGDSPIVSAEEG